MTGREKSPALALWRAELAAGVQTKLDFDPLWRSACLEAEAGEAGADGLAGRAALCRQLAAAVIVVARRRKRKRVPA